MSKIDRDTELARDGRKSSIAGETGVKASKVEQIPERLITALEKQDIGMKLVDIWNTGNAARSKWLERQEKMLQDYDEFINPIYTKTHNWSSTLHLPVALTQGKTFHSRMFSAVFSQDPPFTVKARQSANVERADMVQQLMRYTIFNWANNYEGIKAEVNTWLWNWVMRGTGILKARWNREFTRFEDVQLEETIERRLSSDNPEGITTVRPQIEQREKFVQRTIKTFDGPMVERLAPEDVLIVGGKGVGQSGGEIFKGDLVKFDSDGEIVAASASDATCGVAAHYVSAQGKEIKYYDDPNQEYVTQASGTDIDAQTDINLNYDFVAGAGNSTYEISRYELDSTSGNTTATLPLKLLRVLNTPQNSLGAQVDCIVKINNHQLGSHTGTAGV